MNKLNLITSASFTSDFSFQNFKYMNSYEMLPPLSYSFYNINSKDLGFIQKINVPAREKIKIGVYLSLKF